MHRHECIRCELKIKRNNRAIIYETPVRKHCVHIGECSEQYQGILQDPDAVKKGMIIGICHACFGPVREKEKYRIGRWNRKKYPSDTKECENLYLTTLPTPEDIHFFHDEHCPDYCYGV